MEVGWQTRVDAAPTLMSIHRNEPIVPGQSMKSGHDIEQCYMAVLKWSGPNRVVLHPALWSSFHDQPTFNRASDCPKNPLYMVFF